MVLSLVPRGAAAERQRKLRGRGAPRGAAPWWRGGQRDSAAGLLRLACVLHGPNQHSADACAADGGAEPREPHKPD
ncbi:hypothetical protein STCU_11614 [Strigomonas culicis]|uniref:Uncharacterized protein n=1 Tax=Strigomonas culicis TaxID=28005 RepID=S9UMT1_9TRYP|nr:hypothetical protein STCU_11614 [Strigomonas culicis]|eukprot:EPY16006.1 hypothetical protein STCU_11614 [Strigomonas culicis]